MADLFEVHGIDFQKPKKTEAAVSPSVLLQALQGLGGAGVGVAQGLSDVGANIAQFPGDIYSWATGRPSYQSPKPNIRGYAPQSMAGQLGEEGGEFAAPFISPGIALESALGKAMYGGRLAPRLLTDALLGSAESENRGLGALFGLAVPGLTRGAREIKETPFTQYGATHRLNKAKSLAEQRGIEGLPINEEASTNLEYLMSSPELRPAKVGLNALMNKAIEGSYGSYRDLQSGLKDLSRELRGETPKGSEGFKQAIANLFFGPQSTAAERLTADQLDKVQKLYEKSVREHLGKIGSADIAELEARGTKDYAKHMNYKKLRKKVLLGAMGVAPIGAVIKHNL